MRVIFLSFIVNFLVFCQSPKKEQKAYGLYLELSQLKTKDGFLLIEGQNQIGLFSLKQEKEFLKEYYEFPQKIEPIPSEEPTGRAGNWGGFQFRITRKDPKYLRYTYYRKIPFFCEKEFNLYFFHELNFFSLDGQEENDPDPCPKNLNPKIPLVYAEKAKEKKERAFLLSYEIEEKKEFLHAKASFKKP